MQVHKSLNPSFSSAMRRSLSFRRSSDAKSTDSRRQRSRSPPHTYHDIDMSSRIDWTSYGDPILDQPVTTPPRTMLLIEVADLQHICVNHGERVFKIVRNGNITVRDVLFELDHFLHRRAPLLVGSFARPEDMKPFIFTRTLSSSSESADSSAGQKSPLSSLAVQDGGAVSPVSVVELPQVSAMTATPDRSDSTLGSSASSGANTEKGIYCFEDTVLVRWLGEKRVFAGMKRAENHDYKLIVRMRNVSSR